MTVAGEGSYTIDPTTGAVTFTPEKDFVGTAKGVTVQATATPRVCSEPGAFRGHGGAENAVPQKLEEPHH